VERRDRVSMVECEDGFFRVLIRTHIVRKPRANAASESMKQGFWIGVATSYESAKDSRQR
jgi:hypothetical protein